MLRYEMNDAHGAPLYDYQGFYSLVCDRRRLPHRRHLP
jgi:hypothetical protein